MTTDQFTAQDLHRVIIALEEKISGLDSSHGSVIPEFTRTAWELRGHYIDLVAKARRQVRTAHERETLAANAQRQLAR
jgi:hypothetical protein